MKKIVFILFIIFSVTACDEESLQVHKILEVPSMDNGSMSTGGNISGQSNQFGAIYDNRLSFFDYIEDNVERDIPNNLSDTSGGLEGRVQFAQTHTIDANNNEQRREPSLIPYRQALLMFTPVTPLKKVTVKVNGSTNERQMNIPYSMPKSDYIGDGSKKDITYSKRSFHLRLGVNEVTPNMKLEFTGTTPDDRIITGVITGDHIEYAAPAEAVFLFIQLGMLCDAPNKSVVDIPMLLDPARAMAEYYQTVPFSKLVNGSYEPRSLPKVILDNGTIYTDYSKYKNPDVYKGDMRENVAKAQVSVGIDLANKGVASSALDQSHQLAQDMIFFTVHHTRGRYTDNKGGTGTRIIDHGLSGGNGIGTLTRSTGNEFSHEVDHGFNKSHFPYYNEGIDGSIHGYYSGWGYDSYKNRMIANISWGTDGKVETYQPFSHEPQYTYKVAGFQSTYNWNRDSMADDGRNTWVDSSISRYTLSTSRTTRDVQKFLEPRCFVDTTQKVKDNGYDVHQYIRWNKYTKSFDKCNDASFRRIAPTRVGQKVITILGGYNPENPEQSLVYEYFRGNYGHIFDQLFVDQKPTDTKAYLEITYYGGKQAKYVKLHDKKHNGKLINKLHINIPESEKPQKVALFIDGQQRSYTDIPATIYNTPMKDAVIIGVGAGVKTGNNNNPYEHVIKADIEYLDMQLKDKNFSTYTLNETERERIKYVNMYGRIKDIPNVNARNIASDYAKIATGISKADEFVYGNYYGLEIQNPNIIQSLKDLLKNNNLGQVSFKYNNVEIGGDCLEAYQAENGEKYIKTAVCSGKDSQRWVQDKTGRIHSAAFPGYCMNGNFAAKAITLNPCLNIDRQIWIKRENTKGGFRYECKQHFNITAPNNIGCINKGSLGSNITTYACADGSGNQNHNLTYYLDYSNYLAYMNDTLLSAVVRNINKSNQQVK